MLGTSAPSSYSLDSSPPEWAPQHHEFRPSAITLAYNVGRLDEPRLVAGRAVARDPLGAVTQEILPILEAGAGCPQTTTEGMLEVVGTNLQVEVLRWCAMKDQELTQTDAAHRLGIEQPDVSKRLRGHFRQFSVERLMRFLVALGQDVEIVVRPASATRARTKAAQLTVTAKA